MTMASMTSFMAMESEPRLRILGACEVNLVVQFLQ